MNVSFLIPTIICIIACVLNYEEYKEKGYKINLALFWSCFFCLIVNIMMVIGGK